MEINLFLEDVGEDADEEDDKNDKYEHEEIFYWLYSEIQNHTSQYIISKIRKQN